MDEQQQDTEQQSVPTNFAAKAPPWGDGFQRTVVASTIYGETLTRLPGAFTPDLFGDNSNRAPRWRIAKVIAEYWEQYKARPTEEIVDELLRAEMEKYSEIEQAAVEQEWQYTMVTEVPSDPAFIENEIRKWLDYRNLETGLMATATALTKGPEALAEAWEIHRAIKPFAAADTDAGFAPVTLDTFLYKPSTTPKWIWDGYLTAGSFAELTGYTKFGKSTLAYPLAIAISRGVPFLDRATCGNVMVRQPEKDKNGLPVVRAVPRRVNVLIVGVEETQRDIQERLRRFGATSYDHIHVHPKRLKNSPQVIAEIRAYIKAHDIGFVLIDTISRFWNIENENDNAEMLKEVEPLLDLAHDTGACVLALHHDGKNDNAKGSRGASSLPGLADVILSLKRPDRESNRRELLAEGRHAETPARLDIVLVDEREWEVATGPKVDIKLNADTERVWAALSTPMSRQGIQDATRLSRDRVLEAIEILVADGRVQAEGAAAKGRRYVQANRPDRPAGQSPDSSNAS